jgi:hypothetical protein
MRRAASFLIVLWTACSPESVTDGGDSGGPAPASDAALGDAAPGDTTSGDAASSDAAPQVGDAANDAALSDISAVDQDAIAPPDIADTGQPAVDVGSSDVASVDRLDVGLPTDARATDAKLSDRCGRASLYTRLAPAANMSWADGGDLDVIDARVADTGDVRRFDARLDGDAPDADLDAVCGGLKTEWDAFVVQNNTCVNDWECVLVEGKRGCECPGDLTFFGQGIGDGGGSAILLTAQATAQTYVDRWKSAGCEQWDGVCVTDVAPASGVKCAAGRCEAIQRYCNLPPPQPEPCQ